MKTNQTDSGDIGREFYAPGTVQFPTTPGRAERTLISAGASRWTGIPVPTRPSTESTAQASPRGALVRGGKRPEAR